MSNSNSSISWFWSVLFWSFIIIKATGSVLVSWS